MYIKMLVRPARSTDRPIKEEEKTEWAEAGRGREEEQKRVAGRKAEDR